MQRDAFTRWTFLFFLTMLWGWPWSSSDGLAQSGSGGSGGGTGGGSSLGGATTPGGGATGPRGNVRPGRPVVPRSKSPDGTVVNPQTPDVQSMQRDRAQRLEQQLRQGDVTPTTPQTEMSDRLDQLYKNSPRGRSDTREGGK
jgi:hypothetical protein